MKERETNFIIISKQGINSPKSKRTLLTLKEGEYSLKINLSNSFDNKINQQKILQTISDIRNHFKDRKNRKSLAISKAKEKYSFNENNKRSQNNIIIDEKNKTCANNEHNLKLYYENENCEDTQINIKINKEFSSIIIADENKLSEIDNKIENEIEDNFASSINKKSIRTQINKKDRQKSIQQSDRAEISKINSESDNVTDLDYRNNKVKTKYSNVHLIKSDINEKEEIENELIDNDKDIITELNKNEEKEEKEEKIIIKQNIIKKNNFLNEEKEKEKELQNKDNSPNSCDNNIIIINDSIQDKKVNNEKDLVNENISERKNLVDINQNIFKRNIINGVKPDKNIEKKDGPSNIRQFKINKVPNLNINSNFNSISQERMLANSIIVPFIQKNCFICDKKFYLTKLFSADCKMHLLCKKCLKNYYEEFLEKNNNDKKLKCPCTKCDKEIKYDIIKPNISELHQKLYEKNNIPEPYKKLDKFDYKLGPKDNDTNLKKYTEKNVIDISTNMNFFMFKKSKDIFCPKCLNPNLFSKTNNHFIKCLNCNYKICKYCLKEYNSEHLNLRVEGYCKVYFRRGEEDFESNSKIFFLLLQLFFVIAMYILTHCGSYYFFYRKFTSLFNYHKKNCLYYIIKVFVVIFSLIFFILSFPIIVACYPFFPSIISLCDY